MNTNKKIPAETVDSVAEAVIGAAYEVSNVPRAGFLEEVYERALHRELVLRGLHVTAQAKFPVAHKGRSVGDFAADLVLEDCLLVELKCIDRITNQDMAQCIHYLRAAGQRLLLLINFQKPTVEWKRILYG